MKKHFHKIFALFLAAFMLAFAGWASADPPARVGRLGYSVGSVSFSPAGENEWAQATVNRPIITGDHLWLDSGARAEMQAGAVVMRMNSRTNVTVLNLDDNVFQLQVTQGTINLHVRRLGQNDILEIDTPNLAFSVRQPGDYRIDVDAGDDATSVVTRNGRAEVYSEGTAYTIDEHKSYRFFGTGLQDFEASGLLPPDEFDRWVFHRDRRLERSLAARYVSPDMIGYQDLDGNGTWQHDPEYGDVWTPNRVPAGWAPYHDGHWAWIEPWGWTWVDDAPWGFAVSHYGRWADRGGRWCWVPGPPRERAVYAPALVAFVGGGNFQMEISSGGIAGIGWFPLGPREVYRPAYEASNNYITHINTSNTVVSNTQITNIYNTTNISNVTYANQRVPGAVTAVPATAFTQSQPVQKVAMQLPKEKWVNAPVMPVAMVAPARASVMGAGAPSGNKPPETALARPMVIRTVPPAAPAGFASKEHLLAANPGKPLDTAALATLHRATPTEAARPQAAAPVNPARPARPATALPEQNRRPVQRIQPVVPGTPQTAAPPVVVAPQQRSRPEQRIQPVAPAALQTAAPPVVVAPQQRSRPEQRIQPVAPAAPQTAAPPAMVPREQARAAEQQPGRIGQQGNAPSADAARNAQKKRDEQRKRDEQQKLEEKQGKP